MAFATPYIENGILHYLIGAQWDALSLESQDWQEWLHKEGELFHFKDELLKYTARLEMRENKPYWYAYCTYRKKLHKIYLGKSEDLSFSHLQAAAAELHRRCISEEGEKKTKLRNRASEMTQTDTQERAFQAEEEQISDVETERKGKQKHMDVETIHLFTSTTSEQVSLLFAPIEELLTQRELEILHYLVDGLSNKEIAQHLVLSLGTVKWHLKNLYNKLHVHTRSQAIARARALQL